MVRLYTPADNVWHVVNCCSLLSVSLPRYNCAQQPRLTPFELALEATEIIHEAVEGSYIWCDVCLNYAQLIAFERSLENTTNDTTGGREQRYKEM